MRQQREAAAISISNLFNNGINVMLFIYRRGQNDSSYNNAERRREMASVAENWGHYPGIYKDFPADPVCGPGFI